MSLFNWFKRKSDYNKKWLNISFVIHRNYSKKQKEAELKIELETFYKLFLQAFESIRLRKVTRFYSFQHEGDIMFKPREFSESKKQKFTCSFKKLKKDELGFKAKTNEYSFTISFEPLSLSEFLTLGTAIYGTNVALCDTYKIPFKINKKKKEIDSLFKVEKGELTELFCEGLVHTYFRIRDRLEQARFDDGYDKLKGENFKQEFKKLKEQGGIPSSREEPEIILKMKKLLEEYK